MAQPSEERPRIEIRSQLQERRLESPIIRGAVAIHALMTAFSFALAFVRGNLDLFHHPSPPYTYPWHADLWGGIVVGIAFGLLIAYLSRLGGQKTQWGRRFISEMSATLGPLKRREAFFLSALGALSEEIFFRGLLQPYLGLVVSSLLFGLVHIPTSRVFIPWTLQAFALGLCLGALFYFTGNLAAPITAHFTINFCNLQFLREFTFKDSS